MISEPVSQSTHSGQYKVLVIDKNSYASSFSVANRSAYRKKFRGRPRYRHKELVDSKRPPLSSLRACLKIARGVAARYIGVGRGGAGGASPPRAVTPATTKLQYKKTAARRVFEEKAVWLRCSSVEDPQGVFSFVAPCHPAFSPKTSPLGIFRQALSRTDAEETSRQGRKGRKGKTGGGHFINRNSVHRLAACFPCVSFQFLCVRGGLCVRHSDLN